MPQVIPMRFPKDIVWDETLLKFRYLGKGSDRILHKCPIEKSIAQWCLSICEFARTTPYAGGMQLVCAYEAVMQQMFEKQEVGAHPDDIRKEAGDAWDWHLQEKLEIDEMFTFKPTPENPHGFTILGEEPWEFGLVERPNLDPRIPKPTLRKDKI